MRSTAPAVMDVGENSEFFFLKYFGRNLNSLFLSNTCRTKGTALRLARAGLFLNPPAEG